MQANTIRQIFLDFFAAKGHAIVPAAPITTKDDPSLLFVNAGMNQFKEFFLGESVPSHVRVANTQYCLRVSGKHNDLEAVGIDTYHHTLFEMLGNWSFGDYFKEEAIAWSWDLLTKVYGIAEDRLYVSIFEGDSKENLPKDTASYTCWKEHIVEDHILFGSKKDNFWEMGESGPCGPCSEIHVDCRSDAERNSLDGKMLVNAGHPQVIEIWNNVFIEFNRLQSGSLQPLPAKHVDTGMGFERLTRVLQGKASNYDTDIFQPLIQFIAGKTGIAYGAGVQTDIAMRVLSDHIRAIAFTIADGQLPSNAKAGYVIRRILRRAVRYAYTFLRMRQPFLNTLLPVLAEQFELACPALAKQQDFIQKVILEEEVAFLRTLKTGLHRFEKQVTSCLDASRVVHGAFAFELYDTYGFPIDLTELLAREQGLSIDKTGFDKALAQQQSRSRAATVVDKGDWIMVQELERVDFVGYDQLESTTHIVKYRRIRSGNQERYQIVLRKTPFYAAGGGQVGDKGALVDRVHNLAIPIIDTKKENGVIVHFTDQLPPDMHVSFLAKVNEEVRRATESNHSATHLLHAALRQVLGKHVVQKGSFVDANYLRLDFAHCAKVKETELTKVAAMVNAKIRANIPLKEREVPLQQALDRGILALFGDKYEDLVRVITFDSNFSQELCGGTHVQATGQIGLFKITAESAVAAGVRRIEAVTGLAAEKFITQQHSMIHQLKHLLKDPKDLTNSVSSLLEENRQLKKSVEKLLLEKSMALKQTLLAKIERIHGINFIAEKVDLPTHEAIRHLAYDLKGAVSDLFLVLGAIINAKPYLTILIANDLVKEKGWDAGAIIKKLAKSIQGGGGGQPSYATAGGNDANGLTLALRQSREYVQSKGM